MRRVLSSIIVILIVWIIISIVFKPAEYLFPSLSSVLKNFYENYQVFLQNAGYTLLEILIGFVIANILGLLFAILAIFYNKLEEPLTIVAIFLKTIPIIALAPLLVLWFGDGIWSKIVAVTLTCFIPILFNVLSGAKIITKKYKDILNLYNVNKIQCTTMFILPGIMPYLMSAFKISSSLAIVGALVSEFISANKGLGYLVISNYNSMNIAGVFVCIIISSLIGISIYYFCDILEKKGHVN